jgi:hypothetical protein
MTPIFDGTIRDGKLLVDKAPAFREYLTGLEGKRIQLTVEKLKNTRTLQQNRYYWGVVVKLIAQHTGHDPEQIHELLKMQFSPKWYLMNPGVTGTTGGIPTSTTRLDTVAFVEYTERCRMWANEFLGLNVPLPEEVNL